jgi:hypothetical protein
VSTPDGQYPITSPTARISVEQLDSTGRVFRVFDYHVPRGEVEDKLDDVTRAYNLSATRVTIDGIFALGQPVPGQPVPGQTDPEPDCYSCDDPRGPRRLTWRGWQCQSCTILADVTDDDGTACAWPPTRATAHPRPSGSTCPTLTPCSSPC